MLRAPMSVMSGVAVLVAGTLLGWSAIERSPAVAQNRDGQADLVVAHSAVGLVPGQDLRVSFVNPSRSACAESGRGGGSGLEFRVQLVGPDGTELFTSGQIWAPRGGFGTVALKHRDLNADGEEGTGRVQVGVIAETTCQPRRNGALPTGTVELVDPHSGDTVAVALLIPAVQAAREARS